MLNIEHYLDSNNAKDLLWNDIKVISKEFEESLNSLDRKLTGSYYTSFELASIMMQELIESYSTTEKQNLYKKRFLEPCVGVGNFVFAYLKEVSKLDFNKNQVSELINNIYVCDINKKALEEYKKILTIFSKVYFDIDLDNAYFDQHLGTGLLFDVTLDTPQYISISDIFDSNIVSDGFDIIVTNPPYKNLKAEKGQYHNNDLYISDKEKYKKISNLAKNKLIYSTDGVLNLYKLFVEEIIDKYANKDAHISLLIPSTILSDKTCSKLRTYMLLNTSILSIKVINEGSGYVDAQQSLCTLLIDKGGSQKNIKMIKDFCENPNQITEISIDDILDENTGNAIFPMNNQEYTMLKQLRKFPIIKELDFIINMRGELDVTANKNFITNSNKKYKLLRGRNIGYYQLSDVDVIEYVEDDFIEKSSKKQYILNDRIICQQVVNMKKERRITYAYIKENYVLGNSCNFISVLDNDYGINLFYLLGILNSSIINWYFKLTSSNNHVNNYEIDCFPIPLDKCLIKRISTLAETYYRTKESSILNQIEKCVYSAYGISESQVDDTATISENQDLKSKIVYQFYKDIKNIIPNITFDMVESIYEGNAKLDIVLTELGIDLERIDKIACKSLIEKYLKIKEGIVLNHTTFKLSDLDMEMVRAVPQGGNWKDIPQETVQKSKRLINITKSGGRTTLYGRIDYEKPSYTITTYFNRPGNGTYIHPIHDRVLSVREAARFQGFCDDYYFYGNQGQKLKQVGNAVPTLLAYQIAEQIVSKTGCTKSLDLFCGAGGMTVGFKEAGIKSMLANDIEESACITLKVNNPEIPVLCGDITKPDVKDMITQKSIDAEVDIICGGPPCQGFSMAGFRDEKDPRNQLFRDFVEIVSRVKPKVIVFENVEGLLTFQKGETYKNILELFSGLGYETEGRLLLCSNYAVPQKRKRVIIICVRKEMKIAPSELFPRDITADLKTQVTAKETIADLQSIECSDSAKYVRVRDSKINELFKRKISYKTYIKYYRDYEKKNNSNPDTYEQLQLKLD